MAGKLASFQAEGWQGRIADVIRGRYAGAAHFNSRGNELVDRILASKGRLLNEVNTAMIEVVRDMLGITTPLLVTEPPKEVAVQRLIEQVAMVGGATYLAGQGGRAYMGDEPETRFAEAGLELVWSDHQHTTGDSIVTLLLDYDEPMELVLKTKS